LQSPDYLSKMADLVRENPSITVREIASALQFADSKSVYYWLDKHHFRGINEFKREVLSDPKLFTEGLTIAVNNRELYLARAPLYSWNPKEKNPVGEWCFLYNHPHPQGIFAVRVGDRNFSPWLMPNDILIVERHNHNRADDWILLSNRQSYFLGIAVASGFLIDPRTGEQFPDDYSRIGHIMRQERIFQGL